MLKPMPEPVDILILGAGWTSTFLIPLVAAEKRSSSLPASATALPDTPLTYAATSTSSRADSLGRPTIEFRFDPNSDSKDAYVKLPSAKTVLITFPLKGKGQSNRLVSLYRQVHGSGNLFVQLGSSGVFTAPHWNTYESPHDTTDARAMAEDELVALGGVVLNLAGLYGGTRDPRNWVTRVAKTKAEVKAKKALHLIHGEDVARGILGVHFAHDRASVAAGKRWLLTDLHVYDWWDLIHTWGHLATDKALAGGAPTDAPPRYSEWVGELMLDEGVRALPRAADSLGRVLDSRAFWAAVGVWPVQGRVTS